MAADIAGRFGGHVDRVGFYTPYLISEETLGELAAEMASATGMCRESMVPPRRIHGRSSTGERIEEAVS